MYEALIADNVVAADGGAIATAGHIIYRLECATRDANALQGTGEHGFGGRVKPVMVYVQLEVSEETMSLVAFASEERRSLYRALRQVNGIGRRSALNVLDCGEVIDTLRAVAAKDVAYFRDVPGLGKTRIAAILTRLGTNYADALPAPLEMPVQEWVTARDALMVTGVSFADAESRLRTAHDSSEAMDAEALLAHA